MAAFNCSSVGFPKSTSDGRRNSENGTMIPDSYSSSTGGDCGGNGGAGLLCVTINQARGLQNICIYGNQDVYAKFFFVDSQSMVFVTQAVRAGGKDPVFNQSLQVPMAQMPPDSKAVLRCEIWMMSCARTYLQDQLLGFTLVPLSAIPCGKPHALLTREYSLSSTELFHSPAGTISLSLFFAHTAAELPPPPASPDLMLLDSVQTAPDYNQIEFPDLEAVSENQRMVSEYLNITSEDLAEAEPANHTLDSSQKLLSSHPTEPDSEMSPNTDEDKENGHIESLEITALSSSSVSMAAISTKSIQEGEKCKPDVSASSTCTSPVSSAAEPPTPMRSSSRISETKDSESEAAHSHSHDSTSYSALSSPLVSINIGPEEPLIQQQIVDMYMKSMNQFTECLAKMKLPLDADAESSKADPKGGDAGKKDGNRVFYGSRAFF